MAEEDEYDVILSEAAFNVVDASKSMAWYQACSMLLAT